MLSDLRQAKKAWRQTNRMEPHGNPQAPEPRTCSITEALEIVGDRYTLLVLRELFFGNLRFSDIAENTGAPRDVLTSRLRKLEETGMVERREYQDNPPRHEYLPTQAAKDFYPVLHAIRQWGDDHCWDSADQIPVAFKHDCGAHVTVDVTCKQCGETVTVDSVEVVS